MRLSAARLRRMFKGNLHVEFVRSGFGKHLGRQYLFTSF